MNRRSTFGVVAMAAAFALMLPLSGHAQQPAPAAPQPKAPPAAATPAAPPKPMKEAIVGSWSLLIDDAVKADGTHAPNFGPNPIGMAMFTADGHFSVAITRAGRPKFASNNRSTGTADENKAMVAGGNAFFGTYTLNEADKTLTMRVEGSTYPNLEGTTQKRTITSLTAGDELTWSNPATKGEVAWKAMKPVGS
ncbi:MAG TPA: lipocalin-like domain-containing protein [Xanthobacteraceae bacterium]